MSSCAFALRCSMLKLILCLAIIPKRKTMCLCSNISLERWNGFVMTLSNIAKTYRGISFVVQSFLSIISVVNSYIHLFVHWLDGRGSNLSCNDHDFHGILSELSLTYRFMKISPKPMEFSPDSNSDAIAAQCLSKK